jgi:2-keto-4-pentenoate hydratase
MSERAGQKRKGDRVGAEELQDLAGCLLADLDARTPGVRLRPGPGPTLPEAYELQNAVLQLRQQRGERVLGYKVGCTSRVIRQQLGVDQPIFARIFDTGCFQSGACLSAGSYANLAVEGEFAVRLGGDLAGAPSLEECLASIASVFPVIELHHYVLPPAWPAGPWLVASNGIHAGFVLPEEEEPCRGLSDLGHRLAIGINGDAVEAFAESGTVPGPLRSLRWLAGRLAEIGLHLSRGQVVLTGSPMKLYPVAAGSRIVVDAPPLGASCAEIGP